MGFPRAGVHRNSQSTCQLSVVPPFTFFLSQLSQADKMTIDNLQRKVRSLESQLRSRVGERERRDAEDEKEKGGQTPRT